MLTPIHNSTLARVVGLATYAYYDTSYLLKTSRVLESISCKYYEQYYLLSMDTVATLEQYA